MVLPQELLQIPAPLGNRKHSDQPEGLEAVKRQLRQCGIHTIPRPGPAHCIDDDAPTVFRPDIAVRLLVWFFALKGRAWLFR